MVVRQAVVLACSGLAVGLALALGASRLIQGLLFGTEPTDIAHLHVGRRRPAVRRASRPATSPPAARRASIPMRALDMNRRNSAGLEARSHSDCGSGLRTPDSGLRTRALRTSHGLRTSHSADFALPRVSNPPVQRQYVHVHARTISYFDSAPGDHAARVLVLVARLSAGGGDVGRAGEGAAAGLAAARAGHARLRRLDDARTGRRPEHRRLCGRCHRPAARARHPDAGDRRPVDGRLRDVCRPQARAVAGAGGDPRRHAGERRHVGRTRQSPQHAGAASIAKGHPAWRAT